MGKYSLIPGVEVVLDGQHHKLHLVLPGNVFQFVRIEDGMLRNLPQPELLRLIAKGGCRVAGHEGARVACRSISGSSTSKRLFLDELPDALQKTAKYRLAYVTGVLKAKPRSLSRAALAPVIAEIKRHLDTPGPAPHPATVAKWVRQFAAHGNDARALVDQHHRKGRRQRQVPDSLIELVDDAIDEHYLKHKGCSITDLVGYVKIAIRQRNKDLPKPCWIDATASYGLIRRQIKKRDPYAACVAREGINAARRKFQSAVGIHYADAPLEVAEIDHTTLDVFLVDEKTMLPLGRPTLTICVDKATRCVLGFHLGFNSTSASAVAQCLRHSFLPKIDLEVKYPSVKNQWEPFGVPETLVIDNALEFIGTHAEAICESFGITVQKSPRKSPWFKPVIERLIGSVNRGIAHKLPGTSFSNIQGRGDYDSPAEAVITLDRMNEILLIWIVDVYHHQKHDALGSYPISVWRDKIQTMLLPPLPDSVDDLEAMLGDIQTRQLRGNGVQIDDVEYNSLELAALWKRLGAGSVEVTVRLNPENIGYAYVIAPDTKEVIRVPARDMRYAENLTIFQHRVIKDHARKHFEDTSEENRLAAKEQIMKIVEEEMFSKKMSARKRAKQLKTTETPKSGDTTVRPSERSTPVEMPPEQLALLPSPDVARPAPFKPATLDVEHSDDSRRPETDK